MMDWKIIYTTKLECWDNSTQARHLQFGHLQIIEDLCMHCIIGNSVNYGKHCAKNGQSNLLALIMYEISTMR